MTDASKESWDEYRKQMLAETSRFIEWGLRNPHLVTWIPSKPIEQGSWPRAVSEWFWGNVLSDRADRMFDRWRQRFRVAASLFQRRWRS